MRMRVDWVRQGNINWNRDWLEWYGPNRSHTPELDDHISFVNHDLRGNGCATVEKAADGSLVIDVAESERTLIADILEYHGFALR